MSLLYETMSWYCSKLWPIVGFYLQVEIAMVAGAPTVVSAEDCIWGEVLGCPKITTRMEIYSCEPWITHIFLFWKRWILFSYGNKGNWWNVSLNWSQTLGSYLLPFFISTHLSHLQPPPSALFPLSWLWYFHWIFDIAVCSRHVEVLFGYWMMCDESAVGSLKTNLSKWIKFPSIYGLHT